MRAFSWSKIKNNVVKIVFNKENLVKLILFFIIPYIVLLIIYNIYPFYNYSGEPPYPKLPVKDVFSFKLLFINYCVFLSIMYYIQYIVPIFYLKNYYKLRISSISKIYLVLLIIYFVFALSPAILYWVYTLWYIIPKPYLNEEEAFTVAHGFISAIYSGIIVMYLAPSILYIMLIMMLKVKNMRFNLKRVIFYTLLMIIVQIILLNVLTLLEVLLDGLIIYVFGEQALVIYLRGWNPSVLALLKENPKKVMLMIPSWGTLFSLIIYCFLLYIVIRFFINNSIIK